MKISLKDLRAAPGQRLHISFNEMLKAEEMIKPVIGEVTLTSTSASVSLEGQIHTIVKLQCHSCLKYFFQSLDINMAEEFVYEDYLNIDALNNKERELQKKDFFETVPYYGEIDVSDVIYQLLLLAIPTYCSCGADCPGPPVYNAQAEKIDPRWQNLKTILSNDVRSDDNNEEK